MEGWVGPEGRGVDVERCAGRPAGRAWERAAVLEAREPALIWLMRAVAPTVRGIAYPAAASGFPWARAAPTMAVRTAPRATFRAMWWFFVTGAEAWGAKTEPWVPPMRLLDSFARTFAAVCLERAMSFLRLMKAPMHRRSTTTKRSVSSLPHSSWAGSRTAWRMMMKTARETTEVSIWLRERRTDAAQSHR